MRWTMLLLGGWGCAAGTTEPPAPEHPIAVSVSGQERVVSEDGELTLISGHVVIERAVLGSDDGEVTWFTDQRVDLGSASQVIAADRSVPAGTYTSLSLSFAPLGDDLAFDVMVQGEDQEPLRAKHPGSFTGQNLLAPHLVVAEDDAAPVSLEVVLTGLFFYVRTYSLAEDGVYDLTVQDMDRGFFEGNVAGAIRPVR